MSTDVDAYYNLTIEDFNDSESLSNSLCIKCVKMEMKKIIDRFPAVKSLKIEPILHPLLDSCLGIWRMHKDDAAVGVSKALLDIVEGMHLIYAYPL